jgi:multiple sugar transport system permease protein
MSKMQRRNWLAGMAFTSPFILGFLIFTLYPLATSFYYSFTSYKILTPPVWIGLKNYRDLLSDELFWTAISNTVIFTVMAVPLQILTSFVLAMALNAKIRGQAFYRTIFYLPSLVPIVAVSILWLWLFHTRFGLINIALEAIGIHGIGWLTDPNWAKPSLVLMGLWSVGPTVVIYLAGLQDVPEHLYEAASLDGANWLNKIWYVTVPMMTPVFLFTLIIGLINAFQYFTEVYIMTSGGPINATLMYVVYLYDNAFRYIKMGYASALAWVLCLVVLICTLLILKSSARWVYYGGETR